MNKWDDPDEEMTVTRDLYEVLGVARDATDSQIKRAYHKAAMVHHPDKRASNPHGSDDTFKEIGYAYKVLSDSEKRQIYDMGGTDALEQQEGMANINIDHLLLNILMWESGQKICFLCFLFLLVLELVVLPVLAGLQLDGSLGWSWFGVTTPLWIPIGLAAPIFACAPLAIWKQHQAAGDDAAASMQAKASCVGCVVAGVLVGCLAGTAWMVCYKLDSGPLASFTYFQAIIPVLVVEGLLALSFLGLPRDALLQGLLWKVLRCTFFVLLAMKLDGSSVGWLFVLLPLVVWCVASMSLMAKDVYDHKKLKAKSKSGGATLEEEASRYAGFFFALRAVLAGGLLLCVLLLFAHLEFDLNIGYTLIFMPVVIGVIAAYLMVCWGLLCFRPKELGEYEQFGGGGDPYGTFEEGHAYP